MQQNSSLEALTYSASASLADLEDLLLILESGQPSAAQLRQLELVATTLSGSLDKLSKFVSELPDSPTAGPRKRTAEEEEEAALLLGMAQLLIMCVHKEEDLLDPERAELRRKRTEVHRKEEARRTQMAPSFRDYLDNSGEPHPSDRHLFEDD